jgi:putative ABC transport system permease protein
MSGLVQDLRYAVRQLRKSPGFTTVAVLTLALGIGANTAIFTVVNALLLKMLPVTEPRQLVVVGDPTFVNTRSSGTPRTDVFSYPLYKELSDGNFVFSGLCAAATDHHIEVDTTQAVVSDEKTSGRMVSGNYFTVLGLKPAAGRLFSDSDDASENANPVAVLLGVVIGTAGALVMGHVLSSLIYGVKPTDPVTFLVVAVILGAIALFASIIPAYRAANVDPVVALRYE